ncbi:MAG: NAD(+)/NADH kinase, partial [Senegalimassilia anaerobia]|nr:NAD(+)/NADH kinase [Senegalimassilia anaerobia]
MHILIVRNNSNSQAIDASLLLVTYLTTQGIDYTVVDSSKLASPLAAPELCDLFEHGVDMAVALGGDGTILRTARQVGFHGTPILGINYGRLGFLANPNEAGVMEPLVAALSGDAAHEVRTNLDIRVVCEGEADPYADDGAGAEPDEPREFFALNEVAVTRGANGRIIDFGLGVSGSHLANMRGDGLVVASATGSTAYALSAGGPLVAPGFTGLVAVPIAPHTLHSRAVVTAPSDVVEMDLSENQDDRDATLFIDGELVELDRPLRRLYVRRGDVPTTL